MTSSEAALNDKELINILRDCRKNNHPIDAKLYREVAADRIEQLVATNEQLVEDNKSLAQAQESLVETLRKSGCKRKEAEAKLAKAVDVIKHLINIAPEGDADEWHIALDNATAMLAEMEKTE